MVKVFVYGSLKKGKYNHRYLAGRSMFLGEDAIQAKLFDLGSYPAVQDGDEMVMGEIYLVGATVLRDLDHLEGHPRYYERRQVKAIFSGEEVWVYFLDNVPARAQHLPEGVWNPKAA